MEIMVFGAGYVGLVTGAGLASTGNHVVLADTLEDRIQLLRDGKVPFYEPQLPELLEKARRTKNIQFVHTKSEEFKSALTSAEIYFIGVGTPELPDGRSNLDYVFSAVDMIASQGGDISDKYVIMKSTVPVGTGDAIEKRLKDAKKFPAVISNPEFLKQGNAVQDFLKPERVIIGTDNEKARETISFLYRPFMLKRERIVCMSRRSAELVKYACNAFLATKISFINEMAQFSEAVGADIREVRDGMITDSRIGDQFLFPGLGFGGSCFPKDTHSLIVQGENAGVTMQVPTAVASVNKRQRKWPLQKLKKSLGENLAGKTIAVCGLAFKPNTDDLREAPGVELIEELLKAKALVRAYDPVASKRAAEVFAGAVQSKQLSFAEDLYDAATGADALVIVTEWQDFRTPNFKRLKPLLKRALIIDGRNIYDPKIAKQYGFEYFGVGIGTN
jgi:UDPglucose 6-dehydrogenase